MTDWRRSGLTEKQKAALSRLGKKKNINPFEKGQVKVMAFFGDPVDSKRAESILARNEETGTQNGG